jgi:hypothetical protein
LTAFNVKEIARYAHNISSQRNTGEGRSIRHMQMQSTIAARSSLHAAGFP